MKNTIKRVIQILFILGIILLFSNKVFAANGSISLNRDWSHTDKWNEDRKKRIFK